MEFKLEKIPNTDFYYISLLDDEIHNDIISNNLLFEIKEISPITNNYLFYNTNSKNHYTIDIDLSFDSRKTICVNNEIK